MYVSVEQIEASLQNLSGIHPFFGTVYLAFKESELPVGDPVEINFSQVVESVLQRHYRVTTEYEGFYSPFVTSSPAKRWLSRRYGSTSLQRIAADTFADAFNHAKRTSQWSWDEDYVVTLTRYLPSLQLIPAFDLAVWLYRDRDIPESFTPFDLCQIFVDEFHISSHDGQALFAEPPEHWPFPLQESPATTKELLDLIGFPPGLAPAIDLSLRSLNVSDVGPADRFQYEPGNRLNIITGDNSLGKTFLLDLVWWALTETWSTYSAIPRHDRPSQSAIIECEVGTGPDTSTYIHASYDWARQSWQRNETDLKVEGLVVYARFDGSFTVWDPIRRQLDPSSALAGDGGTLRFSPDDVWEGLFGKTRQSEVICRGLMADSVRWLADPSDRLELLQSCLLAISPSTKEPIRLGAPMRIVPLGAQETPTLAMPYDRVPVQLASAGIRRTLALTYMLVWTWFEHRQLAHETRTRPFNRIVLLIDEVEAHLHPKWQRVLVGSLVETLQALGEEVEIQVHLATHSSMVLASAEPVFDDNLDAIHHLRLEGKSVVLEPLTFHKRGTADFWLMSDVFGLEHPRSLEASDAIVDAKRLQLEESPSTPEVLSVHKRLCQHLAQDDGFWPRWLRFAEEHGVDA